MVELRWSGPAWLGEIHAERDEGRLPAREKRPGLGLYRTAQDGQARSKRGLTLRDVSGFDGLYRNPKALNLAAGKAHADPLDIRFEPPLDDFRHVSADTPAFLRLTFAMNAAAAIGAFARDCAYSSHEKSLTVYSCRT